MDAERVSFLAHEAVSVFETLDDEDAIIITLGNLVAILKDVAREPATVISAKRIKTAVCDKLIARCRGRANFPQIEAAPV